MKAICLIFSQMIYFNIYQIKTEQEHIVYKTFIHIKMFNKVTYQMLMTAVLIQSIAYTQNHSVFGFIILASVNEKLQKYIHN